LVLAVIIRFIRKKKRGKQKEDEIDRKNNKTSVSGRFYISPVKEEMKKVVVGNIVG
jgi:hypothetical protein